MHIIYKEMHAIHMLDLFIKKCTSTSALSLYCSNSIHSFCQRK